MDILSNFESIQMSDGVAFAVDSCISYLNESIHTSV